jgi:hypothetical protein
MDVDMLDLIVERCRRVREQLVEDYGGLDGLFRKLEAMDRERAKSRVARRRKRASKVRSSTSR